MESLLEEFLMKDFDLIIENLYLANIVAANNLQMITNLKIGGILTVAEDCDIKASIMSLIKWKRIAV